MVSTEVSISGYQVSEELYKGSRTLVYRGYRESDSLPVVIKLLKNTYPSFNELVQFRNQYTIAKNLNYPGIIQTYSLETHHNGYALVMEDFGGISLKDYFNYIETLDVTSPLQEFLQVAISLCDILETLYQQRVIHKDIKPANILINPETKQVKLIDFSIASLLSKETQEIKNPNVLEGTLSYISPEQTGRMNRGIDYRSDFYSLGVTFYELLTGKLPFISDDAMELVHCHIAKQPPQLPHPSPLLGKERGRDISDSLSTGKEGGLEIPSVLNDIVMKLMAKNAEDRYQSALGLKHDLETCLYQLKETGNITDFTIAQRDICDRFIIPDKLYGRGKEVEQLLEAFDRVSSGNSEMILVAGFSGIGKTAVINEVHKPIVKQRGYFIKGKFDQFNRNIPLSAFVEALRDLIKQLISETDTQIQKWKSKILAALGENGQVIIDVVPELEKIIGNQPSVTELSGTAAQNRFNLLLQKFVQVFTTKEHPLVMFLDDLQWADSASLNLIQLLMVDGNQGYLLFIGAYRDNEVSSAHPLMMTLNDISKNVAAIDRITLQPLSKNSLNQLVVDTLYCTTDTALPLTQLIHQKTKGNPFFSTQFIKALYEEGLINFDADSGCWQCDITKVRETALTDDVVEFMALQLQKLPESTQNILKLAACIGNQFDLETLAIVSQQSQTQTAADLWKALQEGLILPQSEIYKFFVNSEHQDNISSTSQIVSYKFLHDRIQQAAYSLIPDERQQINHFKIGQLLLENTSEIEQEEKIFEIVNQLNYGIELVSDIAQRDELAQLNLWASRKARAATAYRASRNYAEIGLNFLGKEAWQRQYKITLKLHGIAAEVASLCGEFEQMEQYIEAAISHARTPLEKVDVYIVKIQALISLNKLLEAICIGQSILKEFGVEFPQKPTDGDIQQSIEDINLLIGSQPIEELYNLPSMVDAEKLALMQIAASIFSACYMAGSPLFILVTAFQVKLSIEYGNSPTSAFSYGCYGVVLNNFFQAVTVGSEFGKLAYRLISETNTKKIRSETCALIGLFVWHRTYHLRETLPIFQTGYRSGLETGQLEYFAYNAIGYCLNSYWCGKPLAELEVQTRTFHHQTIEFNQITTAHDSLVYWHSTIFILGNPDNIELLFDNADQEKTMVSQSLKVKDFNRLFIFYIHRTILRFLVEEIKLANADAVEARKYILAGKGEICEVGLYFYDSLIALAMLDESKTEWEVQQQRIEENQTQLKHWSEYAPMNYLHKWQLVEAEKYRVLNNKIEAIEYYDKAIYGAKENEYIQEEALSNELAAKFYLDWGKEKIASSYMQEAYYCYARWGAKAKTDDLEQRYPNLLRPILQPTTQILTPLETITLPNYSIHHSTSHRSSTSATINQTLDFATVIKASQTISRTIDLDELMKTLTRMMLENSGADKCALLLSEERIWEVRAVATLNNVNLQTSPLENNSSIPTKLIQYVKGTQESIVIDNLQTNLPVIGDYLNQYQPKSVLCLPILNQGQLIGILYLENSFTSCVFTNDRIFVLDFLCTQAAISLENARLYSQQQEKNREIIQKEAEYRSIFESVGDGLSIIDLQTGKVISVNPIICQMFLYSKEEWLDLTPIDYLHPDSIHLFGNYLETLKLNKEFYCQGLAKPKDGSFFDFEIKAVPFMYKGKIHGLNIIRDISEQKAAKKALEDTNLLLNSLLQTIPDVFFAKDLQGRYITLNANAAQLVGKPITEIIGQTDNELFPPEFAELIIAKDREIITKGITESLEEVIPINGAIRTFFSVKTPLQDSQGNINGLIGLSRDITDRKVAEEAVIQKSQELEEALEDLQQAQLQIVQNEKMSALGNLVAGVAHEMNNPLGFISASLQQAKPTFDDIIEHLKLYQESLSNPDDEILEHAEDIDLDYSLEDLPKVIDSMVMACDRLKNISTSLRTFSRADKEYKVTFNIHQGIDSTILILKHRLKASDKRPAIEVTTDYSNLPKIQCFPGQLNQVFMNILANAIDALDDFNTGRSFEEIKANPNQITVQTSMDNNSVKIQIADNGKGMSEETKNQIFEHLFTTKGVGKGTGLGLAIAKQIIEEKHGGKLSCNSVLGEGTEFIIEIPV